MRRSRRLLHYHEARSLQVLQQVVRSHGRHEGVGPTKTPPAVMRQRVGEAEQDLGRVGGGEALVQHPPMLRRERIKNNGRMRRGRNLSARMGVTLLAGTIPMPPACCRILSAT